MFENFDSYPVIGLCLIMVMFCAGLYLRWGPPRLHLAVNFREIYLKEFGGKKLHCTAWRVGLRNIGWSMTTISSCDLVSFDSFVHRLFGIGMRVVPVSSDDGLAITFDGDLEGGLTLDRADMATLSIIAEPDSELVQSKAVYLRVKHTPRARYLRIR